jgi:hypothetical protein
MLLSSQEKLMRFIIPFILVLFHTAAGAQDLVRLKYNYAGMTPFVNGYSVVEYHQGGFGFLHNTKERANGDYEEIGEIIPGNLTVPVKKGGWGLASLDGSKIIDCKYDEVRHRSERMTAVREKELWGFCNEWGGLSIKPAYEAVTDFSDGLAGVKINNKWGFINQKGIIVIEPRFADVQMFSAKLAAFSDGDLWGFINTSGETVIPAKFEEVDPFIGYNTTTIAYEDDMAGIINAKGEFVVKPAFDFIDQRGSTYIVERKGKVGLMDYSYQLVLPLAFDKIVFAVEQETATGVTMGGNLVLTKRNGKWGVYNGYGVMAVPEIYDFIDKAHNGLMAVMTGKPGAEGEEIVQQKWGYIDFDGKIIIPLQYNMVEPFDRPVACVQSLVYNSTDKRYYAKNSLFIDQTGKVIRKPEQNEFKRFVVSY